MTRSNSGWEETITRDGAVTMRVVRLNVTRMTGSRGMFCRAIVGDESVEDFNAFSFLWESPRSVQKGERHGIRSRYI